MTSYALAWVSFDNTAVCLKTTYFQCHTRYNCLWDWDCGHIQLLLDLWTLPRFKPMPEAQSLICANYDFFLVALQQLECQKIISWLKIWLFLTWNNNCKDLSDKKYFKIFLFKNFFPSSRSLKKSFNQFFTSIKHFFPSIKTTTGIWKHNNNNNSSNNNNNSSNNNKMNTDCRKYRD